VTQICFFGQLAERWRVNVVETEFETLEHRCRSLYTFLTSTIRAFL